MQIPHSHCQETIQATVLKADANSASVTLSSPAKNSCEACAKRGGCQSLSVYHWFFDKKAIELEQRNTPAFQAGEQLSVSFPEKLLQHAIWQLIGLPLAVFLIGIASVSLIGELGAFIVAISLASAAFWWAKKHLQKRLTHAIRIHRVL